MRILVLALAILLLPLRGWLGDAMAVEMLQQHVAAQATGAHNAHDAHATHTAHTAHTADADLAHHGMDDAAELAPHDDAGGTSGTSDTSQAHAASPAPCEGQSTCSSCQLCHSVAVTVWPEVPMLGKAPQAAPRLAPIAFVSAEPAPGFKPPIF